MDWLGFNQASSGEIVKDGFVTEEDMRYLLSDDGPPTHLHEEEHRMAAWMASGLNEWELFFQ